MTEKRFTYDYEEDKYYDKGFFKDNGKELYKDELLELLNTLHEENEQLNERNENQYQQLNQLWKLIEAKDWETLTAMDNQMKEDEERLQQEWKCYE
jgi:c-di-GMP-related signal transduction protein